MFDLISLAERDPVLGVTLIAGIASVIGVIAAVLAEKLLALVKEGFNRVLKVISESLTTTITVPEKAPFKADLEVWLRVFENHIQWRNHLYDQNEGVGDFFDANGEDFPIEIGTGTKIMIRYQGWWVFISSPGATGDEEDRDERKVIRVTTLFRRRKYLDKFMVSVQVIGKDRYKYMPPPKHLQVWYGTSDYFSPYRVPIRTMGSVILPMDLEAELLSHVQEFFDSQQWYVDMGIPHRMGILMEGPPGSGKTSIAQALACHFHTDLHIIPLGSPNISDDELLELFREIGNHTTFLLMEDLSALQIGQQIEIIDGDTETIRQGITLSGLLNAIDGALSPQHVVFLFTANYAEGLDEALTRFGRIDLRLHFGHATQDQARRLFLRFYPDREAMALQFAVMIPSGEISMAELQFVLTQYKADPESALAWAQNRGAVSSQ